MYTKLTLRQVKHSVRDYLIYLVTLSLCVTLFYAFLSVTSRYYHPDIGSVYSLEGIGGGVRTGLCVLACLILFLIGYVNAYMLRCRKKEFALMNIMGMESGATARLFFAQTFLMGVIALIAGIFFGMLGAQFVTAMLLTAYGRPFHLTFMLFPDTVLFTAAFFCACFLLVGLFDVHIIRKTRLVDMLQAQRVNDKKINKSRYMPCVAILYALLLSAMLFCAVDKMRLYYDARFAPIVRIVFFGNVLFPALALIYPLLLLIRKKTRSFAGLVAGWLFFALILALFAAGVPNMRLNYGLTFDAGTIRLYLVYLIADLLFAIASFIYLAGRGIAWYKEHSIRSRYSGENLFFYGQIISKLNTTSKTMTLICVTLVVSIFMFLAQPALSGWMSGYYKARAVYDIQITTQYNRVRDKADLPGAGQEYAVITDFLEQNHIGTSGDRTLSLYLPKAADFHSRYKYDFPVEAIALSDYNALLRMRGKAPVTLADGEFATQWAQSAGRQEKEKFLKEHKTVATDAGNLRLSDHASYTGSLGVSLYNVYTEVLYVFPDKVCKNLLATSRDRFVQTKENLTHRQACTLEKRFAAKYPEEETGVSYQIRTKTNQTNDYLAGNFTFKILMIYAALVLLIVCFAILALQQLSETGRYRYRFGVLRSLGVEEGHIRRLIMRQLLVWFGLPVMTALLAAAVITVYFFHMIGAQIAAYMGMGTLLIRIAAVLLVLALLLGCYFVSTWRMFLRAVRP